MTHLHNRQTKLLREARKDMRSIAAKMDLHVRAGSIFALNSVIGDKLGIVSRLSLNAHQSANYISIHSEVLYYSMLCSVLEFRKDEIQGISRVHAFFPDTPGAQFLPEIVDLVSDLRDKCNCNVYLFRNDVLDYDRGAMSNKAVTENIAEHGRPRQQHLWPAFAKASHILFRDEGASYGFLKPTRSKSVWGSDDDFRFGYYKTFERLHIKFRDDSLIFIVTRDPDTFEFQRAEIVSSDDDKELVHKTEEYFRKLMLKLGDGLYPASDWENYKVEVALVSGEEMESYAGSDVTLWAVDDFPVQNKQTESQAITTQQWDAPGSTRDIAWTKSVIAALKGAKVRRIFLIDEALLKNPANATSLFEIMVAQHLFLTPRERFSPLREHNDWGGVRLVFKNRSHLWESDPHAKGYPDLALMTKSKQGVDTILGGVIVQPVATYITSRHPDAARWKLCVEDLWKSGKPFPACFSSFKSELAPEIETISKRIAEREELNITRHESADKLKTALRDWLQQTIDKL